MGKLNFHPIILGAILFISPFSFSADKGQVTVINNEKGIEIENAHVKLVISKTASLQQTYFARNNDSWKPVAQSFLSPGKTGPGVSPLYKKGPGVANQFRLLSNEVFQSVKIIAQNKDSVKLLLSGRMDNNNMEEIISLHRGDDHFHMEINMALAEPKLEYALSAFTFTLPGAPDYNFVPALKRADDDVVGDRKFFAPAAIVEKNGYMLALVPDLGLINKNIIYAKGARPQKHPRIFAVPLDTNKISMPTGLDMDLHAGVTQFPLIAYGFMDYWVEQHIYWRHDNNNGAMVRSLSSNKLQYGFDLFIDKGFAKGRGYQRISAFLWQKYGTRYFHRPKPQAMPFMDYAKVCYPAALNYEGYDVVREKDGPHIHNRENQPALATWQQWTEKGKPMGGLRLSAPQWYQFLYNTSWWNNASDATGMYYWGKKENNKTLVDKARRIINFTLSAPQQGGIFPSLYDVNKRKWVASMWLPPQTNYNPDSSSAYWDWVNGEYQTSSASTTAAFLLQYRKACENDPAILPYVKKYGDFLVAHLEPNGCMPAWFTKKLEASPCLKWNAEGGIHMLVLSELYKVTKDKKYLDAAQKMARFMTDEVLPKQRWYDFETFYSCSIKPETFYDKRTGQYPANTMSVCWALDGFASLYEVTHKPEYLKTAEAIADYSIFYQAVWAPHYIITAYPFGGFSSQNTDNEWLDQRSHLFAGALVRVGLLSSRQDLLERGVASARASLTLANLPAHVKNDIYKYPNYPLGLGPENIDHEGFPQMPLRSGPSWAEVGGLSGAANVLRQLGGVYVDVKHQLAVGVDGVSVTKYSLNRDKITLNLTSLLAALKYPYEKAYSVDLHVAGLDNKNYMLVLNNEPAVNLKPGGLDKLPLMVYADGRIEIKSKKVN